MLVHQVFFWLHNPEKDLKAVMEGCRKISSTNTVKDFHVGVPAKTTPRDVVDLSFHISLTVYFKGLKEHDLYQDDQIHHDFIAEHKDKWKAVKVYDIEI